MKINDMKIEDDDSVGDEDEIWVRLNDGEDLKFVEFITTREANERWDPLISIMTDFHDKHFNHQLSEEE